VCDWCGLDLRRMRVAEVEAIATAPRVCDRARAAAEREVAERMAGEDLNDPADEWVD
jgi:hypothetical protein